MLLSAMFAVSRDVSSAIQSMLEFWQESSWRLTHAINPSACMSTMELSCRFNERNKLVKTQVWDASTDAFTKKILRRDSSTGKWSKSPSCKISVDTGEALQWCQIYCRAGPCCRQPASFQMPESWKSLQHDNRRSFKICNPKPAGIAKLGQHHLCNVCIAIGLKSDQVLTLVHPC